MPSEGRPLATSSHPCWNMVTFARVPRKKNGLCVVVVKILRQVSSILKVMAGNINLKEKPPPYEITTTGWFFLHTNVTPTSVYDSISNTTPIQPQNLQDSPSSIKE
jgi:hypothetical protein